MVGSATDRAFPFSLSMGVLGGAALIVVEWAGNRGPLVLLPYAALIIASWAYLRAESVQGWLRRFSMALSSFVVATLFLYLFIGTVLTGSVLQMSLAGHAWRLGVMFLIGSVLSAAVAQLSATKRRV